MCGVASMENVNALCHDNEDVCVISSDNSSTVEGKRIACLHR